MRYSVISHDRLFVVTLGILCSFASALGNRHPASQRAYKYIAFIPPHQMAYKCHKYADTVIPPWDAYNRPSFANPISLPYPTISASICIQRVVRTMHPSFEFRTACSKFKQKAKFL